MNGFNLGTKKGKNSQRIGIELPKSFPLTSQQFSYEVFNTAGNPEFGQAVLDRDVNVALGDLVRAETHGERHDAMQRGLGAIDFFEQDGSPLPRGERTARKEEFLDRVVSSAPALGRAAEQIIGGQGLSRENASLLDAAMRRRVSMLERDHDAMPGRLSPSAGQQRLKLSTQTPGLGGQPGPAATQAAPASQEAATDAPPRTAPQAPATDQPAPAPAPKPGAGELDPKSGATTSATDSAVEANSDQQAERATNENQIEQADPVWEDGTEMVIQRGPDKGTKIPTCFARDKYGDVAVNYVNDEANKPAPDRRVHQGLHNGLDAVLSSDIVKKAGIKSVTINSTSGGEHDEKSNHYRYRAVDISMIDGKPVDHPDNAAKVVALQEAMRAHPKSNETYGPAGCEKHDPTTGNFTKKGKKIIDGHQNHIHFSVWQ